MKPTSLPSPGPHQSTPPGSPTVRHAEPAPTPAEGDPDVIDPRAAVLVPEALLQPGEIIVLLLKPSPWAILLEPAGPLLTLGILWLGAWTLASRGWWLFLGPRDILMLGLLLMLGRLAWQYLEWLSRVYILTDRRVVRIQGVIRVAVFEASLKQIQHTTLHFSLRERLFGLGTIGFATSGTAFTEAFWLMISHPLDVHQVVIRTLNRYR